MSGGAIAIAAGDRVIMLEHSIYSVITPEGCSSILWRSGDKAQDAAAALKITAQDLLSLRIIDSIVAEPLGGAHRGAQRVMSDAGDAVDVALAELDGVPPDDLRRARREKFLRMGRVGVA
jgi:acetyl-CoA carboxylase carboxyl transferase subunit alpha